MFISTVYNHNKRVIMKCIGEKKNIRQTQKSKIYPIRIQKNIILII